jgi:hypothetical protein
MIEKNIRASLAHILLALINADNVIDQGEIKQFALLKKKYGIIPEDILASDSMSFTQAVNNIVEYSVNKNDTEFLDKFYEEAKAMTTSDGLCAQCEARILYALKAIFFSSKDSGIRLLSCKESTIDVAGPKVFFVREAIHTDLSKNFDGYFQEYYYEFLNYGFELINVTQIKDELIEMGEESITELLSIGRPDMIHPKAVEIFEALGQLTPQDVFREILGGNIDALNDGVTTFFLIKICDSKVASSNASQNYYNFLRIPVVSDKKMRSIIRGIVKDYSDCSAHMNPIILPADFNKFRYYSFTKSLFKMLEAEVDRKKKGLKRLVIDAVDMKICLEGLLREGIDVQYKQLALYILISWLSAKNMLLIRKLAGVNNDSKLYNDSKDEGYVTSYIEIAEDKYADIQETIMKYEKDYTDPCSTISQEFGDLKKKLKDALQKEASGQWKETFDICSPISEKRILKSTIKRRDNKSEYQITGYVINLPSSYIFVRVKGKKDLIPISQLFG